jgi:hypothetical protein
MSIRRYYMDITPQRAAILETLETFLELQLKAVKTLLGRQEHPSQAPARRGRRRQSLVDLSVQILTDEHRPLHIDELVDLLRDRYGRVTDRDALSSALAKKARQGVLVSRTSPAHFTLRDES